MKSFDSGCQNPAPIRWIAQVTVLTCLAWVAGSPMSSGFGQTPHETWQPYFVSRVEQIEEQNRITQKQLDDWPAVQQAWRVELFEMLGLSPLPDRGDLQAEITESKTWQNITVENLHFQSSPGLYVTANLFRPTEITQPLPAVLYLCGHGGVKLNGISYGNKVHYHHHGIWLAEHGYVCLIIDSLQLGEIEGIHHGTYQYDRWWWINRGYTSAGVEAWNCIRALDYLATRNDVDMSRVGCTGRSGGGAYSWWVAALDPRIQVAIPVAGITDLRNHIVDNCVSGHCDCMYFINQFGWDYPRVAQLVAPRPLMIANSDQDSIFPLDGVQRTYWATRKVYEGLSELPQLALTITPGPHEDTQDLRVPAFRWLNHHLKQDDSLLQAPAVSVFQPEDLKVFASLPEDQINTNIDAQFVPRAPSPAPPLNIEDWTKKQVDWLKQLRHRTFASWPTEHLSKPKTSWGMRVQDAFNTRSPHQKLKLQTQPYVEIELHHFRPVVLTEKPTIQVVVLDQAQHQHLQHWLREFGANETDFKDLAMKLELPESFDTKQPFITVSPRGIGDLQGPEKPSEHTQWLRKFYLLGETLESGQAWDIRTALRWVQQSMHGQQEPSAPLPVRVFGRRELGVVTAYSILFEPSVQSFELTSPPASHRDGPYLPNVTRTFDIADALACLSQVTQVTLHTPPQELVRDLEAYRNTLKQHFPRIH
jgi:dienelactone hydrolase